MFSYLQESSCTLSTSTVHFALEQIRLTTCVRPDQDPLHCAEHTGRFGLAVEAGAARTGRDEVDLYEAVHCVIEEVRRDSINHDK